MERDIVITVILAVLGLAVIIALILKMWKKVPQDRAAVVTGRKRRVVTGAGTLLIPVLERMDIISLENISLSINTIGAMTIQGVPITATGVAVIKIRRDEESILSAIEQFYTGREETTINKMRDTAVSVLEGKLREIVGKLTVEEIYRDREAFSQQVRDVADSSLTPMGFELKAFTIKEITDQNGYLAALGEPRIAAVRRDADIAKAEAQRDSQIKIAEAKKAGLAAELSAEAEIARSTKEKEVFESEYQKESQTAKAIADAAYEIQKNKMQMDITATASDAEVLKQQRAQGIATEEKEVEVARERRNVILAETRADVKKKMLLETVVNPAEAARQQTEIEAEANKIKAIKAAEAAAETIKLAAIADAEAKKIAAEASAFMIRAVGEKEAEIILQKGKAEAEATRLKLEAEARGMQAKAEAYKQYGTAAITQMLIEALPEMAKNIAEPIGNIDKVIVWDSGKSGEGSGATRMAENVTGTLAAVMTAMKEATGFDVTDILNSFTKSAKTDRNINVSGLIDPRNVTQTGSTKDMEYVSEVASPKAEERAAGETRPVGVESAADKSVLEDTYSHND